MTLNHTVSPLEVSTFRANRAQDLHQEKKKQTPHCKYAQNQRDFNLPKQRGPSVKSKLSVVTIHHHHCVILHFPSDFIKDRDTSHWALLLLPSPGLNSAFPCAAKCGNAKVLQSTLLPCPATGSSNRSFSAAEPARASPALSSSRLHLCLCRHKSALLCWHQIREPHPFLKSLQRWIWCNCLRSKWI